jgi:hypothetical protein
MKIANLLTIVVANGLLLTAAAQTEAPKGFKTASLVLADSSTVSGYIKDNMKASASVVFQPTNGGKKKTYSGAELIAVKTEEAKFTCIKGDFFKVFCEGDLCFLQKMSDASGTPSYNGNEAIFNNGTEGNPNDYFIYDRRTQRLQLISKKNKDEVTHASFAGVPAALEKADAVKDNLAQLNEAVQAYNSRNSK